MATDLTLATDPAIAALCDAVWEGIQVRNIRDDGGVKQNEDDQKLTSEGTGYVGEIAVQMGDRETLDNKIEPFRLNVLQRKNFVPGQNQDWRTLTTNDPRYFAKFLHAWDYRPAPEVNLFDSNTATLETNIGAWVATTGTTAARTTSVFRSGVASLALSRTSTTGTIEATTGAGTGATGIAITPSQKIGAAAWVRNTSTVRGGTLRIQFFKSDNTPSSTPFIDVATLTVTTSWKQIVGETVAPADATKAKVVVRFDAVPASELHYVDDISIGRPGVKDWNYATDADIDIVKYLYWASKKWPDGPYLQRALDVLGDLKKYAFVTIPQGRVQVTDEFQIQMQLTMGTMESLARIGDGHHTSGGKWYAELNPSYWDFEFFRIAKDLDPSDEAFWDSCEQGTKALTYKLCYPGPVGQMGSVKGWPPNWAAVNSDGNVSAITNGVNGWTTTRDTNSTYEAFRYLIRTGQFHKHYGEPWVAEILGQLINGGITPEWNTHGNIAAEHDIAGNRISGPYEKAMMTAAAVRILETGDSSARALAATIKAAKLPTTLNAPSDGAGYSYWGENPTDNGGSGLSYFTDMWMQQYFLEEAGLWNNYGQSTSNVLHAPLAVNDIGSSQDVGDLSADVGTQIPGNSTLDCEEWYWISNGGKTTIDLTRFVDGVEAMAAIEGRGALPTRQTTLTVSGEPGQITTDIQHGPREMPFPLHARGSHLDDLGVLSEADSEELLDVLTELIKAMDPVGDGSSPTAGEGTLRLIRRSGDVFELTCRVLGDGLRIRQNTHRFGFEVIPLVFIADDPYWYSSAETFPFYGAAPRSWFPMIRAGEPWLASSAILGEVSVYVDSDVPTDPVWTVVGPGTQPVITNLDRPTETIQFKDTMPTLSEGEQMVIDTKEGTVTGPNGEDWFKYLLPGSRNMFPLRPGFVNVELGITGSNDQSYVAVSFRNKQVVPRAINETQNIAQAIAS